MSQHHPAPPEHPEHPGQPGRTAPGRTWRTLWLEQEQDPYHRHWQTTVLLVAVAGMTMTSAVLDLLRGGRENLVERLVVVSVLLQVAARAQLGRQVPSAYTALFVAGVLPLVAIGLLTDLF